MWCKGHKKEQINVGCKIMVTSQNEIILGEKKSFKFELGTKNSDSITVCNDLNYIQIDMVRFPIFFVIVAVEYLNLIITVCPEGNIIRACNNLNWTSHIAHCDQSLIFIHFAIHSRKAK